MPYFAGCLLAFYINQNQTKGLQNNHEKTESSKASSWSILLNLTILFICFSYPIQSHFNLALLPNINLFYLTTYQLASLIGILMFISFCYKSMFSHAKSLYVKVLSSQLLTVFGHLSYATYLVHPIFIWFQIGQIRQAQYLNYPFIITFFFQIYIQTIIAALVMYLLVEAPFGKLYKKCSQMTDLL